jgi:hypothetical protein
MSGWGRGVMRAERFVVAAVALGLTCGLSGGAAAQEAKATQEDRASLVARSKVWLPAEIGSMNLRLGPEGSSAFEPGATVTCDFFDKDYSGATPKFGCRLPGGEELKVKYGGTNGEVYAEVAASRLLWALGFGADRMYSVRVICRGCPEKVGGVLRANGDRILDPAAVERKAPGREVADRWAWRELDQVDPAAGGASKAERDALALLAVLIQHSDSKPDNHRIVCVEEGTDGACRTPMMMIQDLGVSFGRGNALQQHPRASVNLAEWRALPVWKDRQRCVGNLTDSVLGTLEDPVISEAGRQFLAGLLVQLSDQQIRDMFEVARVHLRPRTPGEGRSGFPSVDEWVDAFKQKRAEIVDHRCAA